MQSIRSAHGIANGHWEREESRSAWLLLLARMGVAELRTLGELARAAARPHQPANADDAAASEHAHSAAAAE